MSRVCRPFFLALAIGFLLAVGALLRLLRPIVFIRLGLMNVDRIGHLCHNTEQYLRRRAAGIEPKSIDIFIANGEAANEFLLKCARSQMRIVQSSLLTRAYQMIQAKFKGVAQWSVWVTLGAPQNNWYEINELPPALIRFTPKEEEVGARLLAELGVPPGGEFVCFANRSSGYLADRFSDRDFSYHDYRDSSLQSHMKAAGYFAEKGLWAFRMGISVTDDLPAARHPRIVDYATTCRSPFGDVFLLAKCKFFITGNTGNMQICTNLKKPIVVTNLLPVGHPPIFKGDIFIFKKHVDIASGRELSLQEIIDRGLSRVFRSEEYTRAGVAVVENTEEEILQAAVELDQRLDGVWVSTPEDEALQERFWSFFPEGTHAYGCKARVSAHFLRVNQSTLF